VLKANKILKTFLTEKQRIIMKLCLLLSFLIFALLFLVSAGMAIVETRYMTSNLISVNGLTARNLSTSQSSSLTQCEVTASNNATWGIMVWKRNSAGYETSITPEPVAKVSRNTTGSGYQSTSWLAPNISLSINDSIVVRVYVSPDGNPWQSCANFTTERLGAYSLTSSSWNVYYYTNFSKTINRATFRYGSPSYNSRIENFSYSLALSPGEANFTTPLIIIPDGQIHLSGNLSYLVTYWEAYYSDGSERDVGAVCFLNCDERFQDCSSAQNCSLLHPPGRIAGCSILYPNYRSLNSTNFVSCRIYDPLFPELTKGYLNKTFIPVNFDSWLSDYSSVVGEEFNFPVNIKNSGLFSDTYRIQAWSNKPAKVYINPATQDFFIQLHGDAFDPHAWNETGPEVKQAYIKLALLDASDPQTYLYVNVTSSFGFSKLNYVILKSNFRSVPEINSIQIFLIILIATIFILKLKKKI
jgi:hypothetical protein